MALVFEFRSYSFGMFWGAQGLGCFGFRVIVDVRI